MPGILLKDHEDARARRCLGWGANNEIHPKRWCEDLRKHPLHHHLSKFWPCASCNKTMWIMSCIRVCIYTLTLLRFLLQFRFLLKKHKHFRDWRNAIFRWKQQCADRNHGVPGLHLSSSRKIHSMGYPGASFKPDNTMGLYESSCCTWLQIDRNSSFESFPHCDPMWKHLRNMCIYNCVYTIYIVKYIHMWFRVRIRACQFPIKM